MPIVAQRALAAPATVDRAARTVEVVWSTGARARNHVVGLGAITEELDMRPEAVRMAALRSGQAPVLNTHRRGDARDVLGRVTAARLEAGRGYATLQFSTAADIEPVWQRVAEAVAYAQIGIVGFDGQIELEALRLYGLPEHAPALLCGTPSVPVGQREFAAEVSWDLPNLAPGATSLLDVTVTGCRQGDLADAALASSTRFIELDAAAWTNNTVRVMARNISPTATFDLGPATLSVAVTKRQVP
ncbi:hypothetical protein JYK14_00335 [Siccirubricoccus sp. KC 17139]|uniref:Uncharacterized protein n=1 Tax=Siccirubricoccus soli TaxID=2899147 RepID=A0ABT1D053_9PROT|nr:hypothetical protein [Siccirubricoccus soli]MCO6414629.1 hypothetical protein [Siccirubricoccus soli]MCP2680759.1 hypothetical protein [Siccirubricoccus soli]